MRHQRKASGFTLIEISIVILLLTAILGASGVIFSTLLRKYQNTETQNKLRAIQEALYNYRVAFNQLPCPADITLALGHTHFGVAAANEGACTGGVPAANFVNTDLSAQEPRGGMVPVTTLQLPIDYAFDGWGRRIMYHVNKDLTQNGAFTIVNGVDPTQRMTILNDQGQPNTTLAGYVLLSGGPNGHGMYPRAGGTLRVNASSTNTDELNNCDCDAATTATGMDKVFVQKEVSENPANLLDSFDDILIFGTRIDMLLKASMSWSIGPSFVFDPGGGGGDGVSNGGGATGGVGPGGGEDPLCNLKGKSCFPAGTAIDTPSGKRPIERLKRGDLIFSVDGHGNLLPVFVRGTMSRTNTLLTVITDKGSVETTAEHPFWVGGEEFREAGTLKKGDTVMMWREGAPEKATVSATKKGEQTTVYNIEVDDPHTYIAEGFIVHNKAVAVCTSVVLP